MPMVCITFPDEDSETKALGFLAGRANFTTYANGETIVESMALGALASQGIPFNCHGHATYSQTIPTFRLRELGLLPDESKGAK